MLYFQVACAQKFQTKNDFFCAASCIIDVIELISCDSEHVHKLNTQLNTKTKRKAIMHFLKQREMENTGF